MGGQAAACGTDFARLAQLRRVRVLQPNSIALNEIRCADIEVLPDSASAAVQAHRGNGALRWD